MRAHIDAEARGDFDGALATFHRPRYEIMATGEVHDGAEAVSAFYDETARAFPNLGFRTPVLRHSLDAVTVETTFHALHAGPWRGLPATGRRVEYAMMNLFSFEEERLVLERMYFDLLTPLRQIGVSRDPVSPVGRIATALNHPLVVGGAFLRALLRAR
ncbi:MAG: ester cyclase [Polyangiaceae bacterium]